MADMVAQVACNGRERPVAADAFPCRASAQLHPHLVGQDSSTLARVERESGAMLCLPQRSDPGGAIVIRAPHADSLRRAKELIADVVRGALNIRGR